MAKFNMKGAKGEKVGFTKKTVYTAIKGIYASFFFLYCIIPRLYPDMRLFWSGSEFWSEQILKIVNSRAKFTWAFIFFYQLLFSLSWKKRCFLTLEKPVLETHRFKSKILPRLYWESLTAHQDSSVGFKLAFLDLPLLQQNF